VPVEPLLILILAAVGVNCALMAYVAVLPMLRRRRAPAHEDAERSSLEDPARLAAAAPSDSAAYAQGVPIAAYDRVVRISSWAFILVTISLVALTDLWADSRIALIVLLAIAGAFVLVIHDILPAGILGPAKFVVEGSAAVTFITLIVALTGGATSPFFFAYPLVVVGAALVVSTQVTILLAVVASVGYAAAAVVAAGSFPLPAIVTATVAIELVALALLAYVAAFVAREQRRSRDAAIRLSTIDSLTGLFNRSFFFAALDREIARSDRSGRRFCLLMMDLDGLKAMNDRHGHFVGDRVLRGVGDVIRVGIRRIDTPARLGGDEFVVVLPETDPSGAFVLAEKIRQGVAERTYDSGLAGSPALHASISVGVVTYPDDGRTADELMISADRAMYASKRSGKNRVIDYASARASGGGNGGMSGIG
jgi:diguanylate cyclase (GGDEF)-like protein